MDLPVPKPRVSEKPVPAPRRMLKKQNSLRIPIKPSHETLFQENLKPIDQNIPSTSKAISRSDINLNLARSRVSEYENYEAAFPISKKQVKNNLEHGIEEAKTNYSRTSSYENHYISSNSPEINQDDAKSTCSNVSFYETPRKNLLSVNANHVSTLSKNCDTSSSSSNYSYNSSAASSYENHDFLRSASLRSNTNSINRIDEANNESNNDNDDSFSAIDRKNSLYGRHDLYNVPRRNHTDSISNSIYNEENNILKPTSYKPDHLEKIEIRNYEHISDFAQRISNSVLTQFDPLENKPGPSSEVSYDLKLLDEFLQGNLYGRVSSSGYTFDEVALSVSTNESDSEEFVNPPTPPERVDSLIEGKPPGKTRTSWFVNNDTTPKPSGSEGKKNWISIFKDVLEKPADLVRGSKNKDNVVNRPVINSKSFVQKRGMLYKVQSGPVEDLFGEYSARWCILEISNFMCYSDNTCEHLKENFPADTILSVQILNDSKHEYKYDNNDLYCFKVVTTGKSRGGHIYGTKNISERRDWLQCLAKCLIPRFSSKVITDYTRLGWAYIREGVSGNWQGAWLALNERELHYAFDNQSVSIMNLKKARCVILQPYQENEKNPRTNDKGPNLLIDCPESVVYFRMWTERETKLWCNLVKTEATNNGPNLDQQQLTENDIPVIVEKCINFIYVYGSMTEGIYRRPGTGTSVSDILSQFRNNAFAVQLTSDKYTEFDVSTALKRFFRDLPEPLLSVEQCKYFYQVSKINDRAEKIRMYMAALDQLSPISYKTARKLIGHLHFISSQHMKNLMNISNLAAIWGPTLIHCEEELGLVHMNAEHQMGREVLEQLISMYRYIFPDDPGEMEKENHMLTVLEKYYSSSHGSVEKKKAGEFRVWIYLNNKEGKTLNVSIGPNKTAHDLLIELHTHMQLDIHQLAIEEVVLNDRLYRPVHHTEKVLDVVLRWSYWDEIDRKDNYLVLVPIVKYSEYFHEQSKLVSVSSEVKFSDLKSKNFKTCYYNLMGGKLTFYKDRGYDTEIYSCNINDILWYLGHESKRSIQTRWTVTFIDLRGKQTRTKGSPYFGNVLSWNEQYARSSFVNAMLKFRYPENILPDPQLVNLTG